MCPFEFPKTSLTQIMNEYMHSLLSGFLVQLWWVLSEKSVKNLENTCCIYSPAHILDFLKTIITSVLGNWRVKITDIHLSFYSSLLTNTNIYQCLWQEGSLQVCVVYENLHTCFDWMHQSYNKIKCFNRSAHKMGILHGYMKFSLFFIYSLFKIVF